MKMRIVPGIVLITVAAATRTCPISPGALKFADEEEPGIVEALEDDNCDLSSDEVATYLDCMSKLWDEYGNDYLLHEEKCAAERAAIPGCGGIVDQGSDAVATAASLMGLSLDTLGEHVPLKYECPRPESNGDWFAVGGANLSYAESYSFAVTVNSESAFSLAYRASFDRHYTGTGTCDERQEISGTGDGTIFGGGFLQGGSTETGLNSSECVDPAGIPFDPVQGARGNPRWLLGFLSDDLLTLTLCTSFFGAYELDPNAIREGGLGQLISDCHPHAFPGLLTCALVP